MSFSMRIIINRMCISCLCMLLVEVQAVAGVRRTNSPHGLSNRVCPSSGLAGNIKLKNLASRKSEQIPPNLSNLTSCASRKRKIHERDPVPENKEPTPTMPVAVDIVCKACRKQRKANGCHPQQQSTLTAFLAPTPPTAAATTDCGAPQGGAAVPGRKREPGGASVSKARVFNKIGSQGLFPGVLTACTCDMHN